MLSETLTSVEPVNNGGLDSFLDMKQVNSIEHEFYQEVRRTTFIEAPRLSEYLGTKVTIASETFQRTGSFKFRAAYYLASQVAQSLILTTSSGNFGQALACACSLLGKSCVVVMPTNSAHVKINAVREYGGGVDLVDVRVKSRVDRVKELAKQYPEAYVASSYDDPLVIEGNSSLGVELARFDDSIDLIVAPIGGGGLTSGIILGLKKAGNDTPVIGAEPLMANDAARSLRAGYIVRNDSEPQTVADGVRTLSLGENNWPILRNALSGIVEVSEEKIREAVRLLFHLANLKTEPTGALSIAALLTQPNLFRGRSICCVVSGGNVDLSIYQDLLSEQSRPQLDSALARA